MNVPRPVVPVAEKDAPALTCLVEPFRQPPTARKHVQGPQFGQLNVRLGFLWLTCLRLWLAFPCRRQTTNALSLSQRRPHGVANTQGCFIHPELSEGLGKNPVEEQHTFAFPFPFVSRATGMVGRIFKAFIFGIIGLGREESQESGRETHGSPLQQVSVIKIYLTSL